jgi:uncharacterized protein YjeT (DUF2065 family)
VEAFGWLILMEGALVVLAPHLAAAILHLPALSEQAANFYRLAGVLVSGVGMLYTVSGRLDAQGFIFASLLDRPLVPIVMGVFLYFDFIPWPLAAIFAIQDFGSFLWTLSAWRSDRVQAAIVSPG